MVVRMLPKSSESLARRLLAQSQAPSPSVRDPATRQATAALSALEATVSTQLSTPAKDPRGQSRPLGRLNKARTEARLVVGRLVDRLSSKVEAWIREVHDGIPERGPDGEQLRTEDGRLVWVVAPSPKEAARLYASLLEFRVPKLQKTELAGAGGEPLSVVFANVALPAGAAGSARAQVVVDGELVGASGAGSKD